MTTTQKDGGQAYPAAWGNPEQGGDYVPGMSLRAYAAIHLHQPDSGIDWLDEMIRAAARDKMAGQALMSLPHLCAHDTLAAGETFEQHVARNAYSLADAMLKAREASE